MKSRKFVTIIVALLVLSTLVITVFADTADVSPYTLSVYFPMSGNTTQNGNTLVSTMSVRSNPDSAILRIKQQVYSNNYTYPEVSGESAPGVLSYTYSRVMGALVPSYPPTVVYVAYEVYGGSKNEPQVVYNSYSIDASQLS